MEGCYCPDGTFWDDQMELCVRKDECSCSTVGKILKEEKQLRRSATNGNELN